MSDAREFEIIMICSLSFMGLMVMVALGALIYKLIWGIRKKKIESEIFKVKRENGIHTTKQKFK